MTAFVRGRLRDRSPTGAARTEAPEEIEAELYARAKELQVLNEGLRQAHAREREVAVTLQQSMLPLPDPRGTRRWPCATCPPPDR